MFDISVIFLPISVTINCARGIIGHKKKVTKRVGQQLPTYPILVMRQTVNQLEENTPARNKFPKENEKLQPFPRHSIKKPNMSEVLSTFGEKMVTVLENKNKGVKNAQDQVLFIVEQELENEKVITVRSPVVIEFKTLMEKIIKEIQMEQNSGGARMSSFLFEQIDAIKNKDKEIGYVVKGESEQAFKMKALHKMTVTQVMQLTNERPITVRIVLKDIVKETIGVTFFDPFSN